MIILKRTHSNYQEKSKYFYKTVDEIIIITLLSVCPINSLVVSDNFFDVDMKDALNILDIDQMDGVMQVWRQEAHKKL